MARVFIENHLFSQDWFKNILPELLRCEAVIFIFSNCQKGSLELSKVRQALSFQKLVIQMKSRDGKRRGELTDRMQTDQHVKLVEKNREFINCNECDDAHVFALVYVRPTQYIFSMDKRMAKCRNRLRKFIDKRYLGFIVIPDEKVYARHRLKVLS